MSILIIWILSLGIYSNSLKNGFAGDDEGIIVENPFIKDVNNLSQLLGKKYFALSRENSYRPVVTFTYFADFAVYGLKPWGYHLTNLLLHSINGLLLYIFIAMAVQQPLPGHKQSLWFGNLPLIIALLFISHPVLTETVNAISFREDLLAFFFYMGTLCIYLLLRSNTCQSASSRFLYAFSCLSYFFALLSKEMAVTLPLIIFCYEWIYGEKKNKKIIPIILNHYNVGYLAVTLVYVYLRFYYFYNPEEGNPITWTLTERLLSTPWLFLSYFKLTIFPASLSADYTISPVASIFPLSFIVSSIIPILTMALITTKMERAIAFGIIFFIVTLIPVYNIIPLLNPMAERYLYLPASGLVIVMGLSIYLTSKTFRSKEAQKLCVLILLFLILSINSFAVINRNTVWRDNYSLWSDTVRKMPNSSRAHNNLGRAYAELDKHEEAIRHYKTALSLQPSNTYAHENLGLAYYKAGLIDKAVQEYQLIIKLNPDDSEAYNSLGNIYATQGRFSKAMPYFNIAIRLKPDNFDAYVNLGAVYHSQGRLEEAITEYKAAEKLNPGDSDTHYNIGLVYMKQGMLEKAIQELQTAGSLNPDDPDIHYTLADIYYKQKQLYRAKKELETTLRLKPGFLPARKMLEALNMEKPL